MAKDFDLNSQKWLALVFANKNKEYGAYVHRDESSNRHLQAIIIISVVALCLIFLPNIIKSVLPAPPELAQTTELKTVVLDLQEQLPEENIVKAIEVPPPPEIKASVAFVAPVIVEDEKVRDEDLLLTQQELTESKVEISIATTEGSIDSGVNIADLREHQVVLEEKKEEAIDFNIVEEQPKFPGGNDKIKSWFFSNYVYPNSALEMGIAGTITIKFVVKKDGTVGDVEILRGLDSSCDREARRVMAKMPKWTPGRQNGNPVEVFYIMPVKLEILQGR